MELRQLRYFVTIAEELHFGRAATREHIVQSALSQQLQRLERELGVLLLERTTHHVLLTPTGAAFLVEARQILAHVDRAEVAAMRAVGPAPTLRVCVADASYDSMPQILQAVQQRFPELEIHQIEAGVPDQYRLLMDGRLDAGIGRASLAPPEVTSELIRLDPMGVLISEGHRLAALPAVPVAKLAAESLLLAEEQRAPEFNQFVVELCRSAGFTPTEYRGTVESLRAAIDLVLQGRCVLCTPASSAPGGPGITWRLLVEPLSRYPWSVLWRASNTSQYVRSLVACSRALSGELSWLQPRSQAVG
jgi:DNA-binding transcriptional LysR family regulator